FRLWVIGNLPVTAVRDCPPDPETAHLPISLEPGQNFLPGPPRSCQILLICIAQDLADLVHAPGYCRLAEPQYFGRLGMGELLAGDQHHRIPVGWFEPRDRAPYPDLVVQIAPVRGMDEPRQYGEPFREPAKGAAAAMVIAAAVEDDAAEPGCEFRLAAEAADLLDKDAAHVLGDVLRIRVRSRQLPRQPVNPVVVFLQELSECGAVAAYRGCYENL